LAHRLDNIAADFLGKNSGGQNPGLCLKTPNGIIDHGAPPQLKLAYYCIYGLFK